MPRLRALRTTDLRQSRRDKRLERHHVRVAPRALGELNGLAGAPALRAGEPRTGPETHAQIDSSACEVEIAAHHAPRRLELQRKARRTASCSGQARRRSSTGQGIRPTSARSGASHTHLRALRTRAMLDGCVRSREQGRLSSCGRGKSAQRPVPRRGGTDDPRPGRASAPACCWGVRLGGPRALGASDLTERAVDGEPA